MNEILLGAASAADLDACAEIAGTSELYARYGRDTSAARAALAGALADPRSELWCARAGGEVAGFTWMVSRGGFDRGSYLRLIAVRGEHRGRGIGAMLMAAAEERHLQPSGLFLLVSDFNQPAQRFYQRLGYRQIGSIPSFAAPGIDELVYYKPPPGA